MLDGSLSPFFPSIYLSTMTGFFEKQSSVLQCGASPGGHGGGLVRRQWVWQGAMVISHSQGGQGVVARLNHSLCLHVCASCVQVKILL